MVFGAGIGTGPTDFIMHDSAPAPVYAVGSSAPPSSAKKSSSHAKKAKMEQQTSHTSSGRDVDPSSIIEGQGIEASSNTGPSAEELDDLDFLMSGSSEDFLGLGLDFDL